MTVTVNTWTFSKCELQSNSKQFYSNLEMPHSDCNWPLVSDCIALSQCIGMVTAAELDQTALSQQFTW